MADNERANRLESESFMERETIGVDGDASATAGGGVRAFEPPGILFRSDASYL